MRKFSHRQRGMFLVRTYIITVFFFLTHNLFAQHTYLLQNKETQHILDRLEIKSGEFANDYFHTTSKSYRRKSVAEYIDSFPVHRVKLSEQDYFNMQYLINDNFEWSKNESGKNRKAYLKHFYKQKAALYSVQIKDFNLIVNPVINYQVSSDKFMDKPVLLNNRGIEIRGNITDRIGFYTQVSDEILQPYTWVEEYRNRDNGTLMYTNFYKSEGNQYNYFLSSAYVSVSLNKYMDLQFGQTRNFIGDGYRTFILGDVHPEYMNMRLNTRIWKLNYTNIWAELRDPSPGSYTVQPRHYMATHHLSLNVSKSFNLGLFETILFQRDSGYVNTGFDWNYLNPIIFYKSIENGLNSTDKAIIGINYKWNFKKHFSLYGQIVFSEFVLAELKARNGWMHNKFSIQTGIKYIDVAGVKNLDVQAEFNMARPFHYSSYNPAQSFSNFRQYMAHPLGANFYEAVGILRYQPWNRIFIQGKLIYALYGNDTNGSNWGKDLRLGYNTHTSQTYGNYIGQGVETQLLLSDLTVSWMPAQNLFIDFRAGIRNTISELDIFKSSLNYITVGVRLNAAYRNYDF